MNQDLSIAFVVLAVGMVTVFVILGLVVLTGNLLIKFVNRFYPVVVQQKSNTLSPIVSTPTKNIKKSKLAAIVAAVDLVSAGKAKIERIEKINPDL